MPIFSSIFSKNTCKSLYFRKKYWGLCSNKITITDPWLYYLGFHHSSFTFAQEANIHENKFNSYKVPSGLLILFLEKALTLIHMETHLNDVSTPDLLENEHYNRFFCPCITVNLTLFCNIERRTTHLQSAIFAIDASQLWCFCGVDWNPTNRPGDWTYPEFGSKSSAWPIRSTIK
jgi:hypothetical protein